MWNLKGGIMPHDYGTFNGTEIGKKIDWMAGLEIEIPLSQRFNIETGARYNAKQQISSYGSHYIDDGGIVEVPIRFAYKCNLNNNLSLHVGLGPYASYNLHSYADKFQDNLQVGLEPSLALNWKCLSLGVMYDYPVFNGTKPQVHNAVMATLGIRFKSSAWKYVGVGALAVATVGVGAVLVAGAMKGDDSGSNSSSGSYSSYSSSDSSSDYSSSSKSGSGNSSSRHSASEVSAKNIDSNTYGRYESQLIKMNAFYEKEYNDSQCRDIQQKMKKIREKWEGRGYRMFHSEWEDWDGRKR